MVAVYIENVMHSMLHVTGVLLREIMKTLFFSFVLEFEVYEQFVDMGKPVYHNATVHRGTMLLRPP